jgi:FMN phosphatase YigB (HAD superfamily)
VLALLDPDGTLVDRDAGLRTWLAGFAAEHCLDDAGRAWLHAWDQETKERGAFFAGLVDHFGLAVHPDALWKQYRAVMPHVTPAFEGVQPELVALRQHGWRLVVVSNGRADNQLGKLRRTGLAELLDDCFLSEQTGFRKPDPRAFQQAVGEPADAWMIGDDPALDADAASRAGLFSVWISHGRRWPEALRPPAVTVATPADALDFLLGNPPPPAPQRAGSR